MHYVLKKCPQKDRKRCVRARVCCNLAYVVCAIGLYELTVLSPGGGVVETGQSGQILLELGAEGRSA